MNRQNNNTYRHRYLPILSLALLAAVAAYGLRLYLLRPPEDIRRKTASFQVTLELIREYHPEIDTDRLFHAAMQSIIQGLNDPYSRYLTPAELQAAGVEIRGQFGGVGIRISPANGEAVIVGIVPGGAAQEAGIEPGDMIVSIDGVETSRMSFHELVSTVRGRPGTRVNIAVRKHDTEEEESHELRRTRLDTAPMQLQMVENGIAMIRLQEFSARTVGQLREILAEALREDAMKALILDLRDNPGGLLEVAVDIADMFLPEGRIATVRSLARGEDREIRARRTTLLPVEMPMAVLVNERSASASELLAGALQSHGRAGILGTGTVGKGAIESLFELPDGSGLALKVAVYTAGDDVAIESTGITPDIVVGEMPPPPPEPDPEQLREWLEKYRLARAQQQERAVEYINDLIAR